MCLELIHTNELGHFKHVCSRRTLCLQSRFFLVLVTLQFEAIFDNKTSRLSTYLKRYNFVTFVNIKTKRIVQVVM